MMFTQRERERTTTGHDIQLDIFWQGILKPDFIFKTSTNVT